MTRNPTRLLRRRRLPEFTNNHERWLVSYADFLTLLFAFFVAMYSTSAVNSGKFRVLSDSIVRALNLPGLALSPAELADTDARSASLVLPEDDASRVPLKSAANEQETEGQFTSGERGPEQLRGVEDSLQSSLGDLVNPEQLSLSSDGKWLDIKIPANLLFPSGSRALLASAPPLLERLAQTLSTLPNEVVVQGHTDDQLIRNGLFPSNWELSTARAAAVVRVLEEQGVASDRLSAQGYAATRPVADNQSEEGRAENRRVVLRVRNLIVSEERPLTTESSG